MGEAHQGEAAQIVGKYTKIPAEQITAYHFQKDGAVIMDDVQFWVDYLKRRGDVKADWIMPESVATNAYNERVK